MRLVTLWKSISSFHSPLWKFTFGRSSRKLEFCYGSQLSNVNSFKLLMEIDFRNTSLSMKVHFRNSMTYGSLLPEFNHFRKDDFWFKIQFFGTVLWRSILEYAK